MDYSVLMGLLLSNYADLVLPNAGAGLLGRATSAASNNQPLTDDDGVKCVYGPAFWERAGVRDRIDLRIAPALETLDQLIQVGETGRFDIAFIDADKTNYLNYYERCLELLRPGGLVMFDNTLWGGSVANPTDEDQDTLALRELNDGLHKDRRVSISLVPIGDGLTLARKR